MGSLVRKGMDSLMSILALRKPSTRSSATATQNSRPSAAMASSKKPLSAAEGGQNTSGACAKWISPICRFSSMMASISCSPALRISTACSLPCRFPVASNCPLTLG
ncbi:hypothetical protein D3C78_1496820 [compost metagenome]